MLTSTGPPVITASGTSSSTVNAYGVAAAVVWVGIPGGEVVDEGQTGRGAAVVVVRQREAGRHRQVCFVEAEAA